LTWKTVTEPKINININQPVLVGFGELEFNPTYMMTVQASGAAHGAERFPDLKTLYETWSEYTGT
jgi:hypothetical protein